MMMKKRKIGQVPPQVKRVRAARRQIEIEEQTPKVTGKTFLTHKKDYFDKEKNSIDVGYCGSCGLLNCICFDWSDDN